MFVGSLNLAPRSVALNTDLGFVVDSEELAVQLSTGIERAMQPTSSWRISLDDGDLVRSLDEGVDAVEHRTEPGTTWGRRCKVCFLGVRPIEGQL